MNPFQKVQEGTGFLFVHNKSSEHFIKRKLGSDGAHLQV